MMTKQKSKKPGVSFVIPCYNEEKSLPLVLEKITRVCKGELASRPTEIVVADNGSEDNSAAIAKKLGARVVHCEVRGYGAALLGGIRSAKNEIIVFADADNTYDFLEAPRLIAELEEKGVDLVIGSRLDGHIHAGAMPFLHRYVGTPVLTGIINLLYAGPAGRMRDCNSGFRCFRKSVFASWKVESTGMEFASEMLIGAMRTGSRFSHVPISLWPDRRDRVPHLRTWRDGMRHLLQVLLHSPEVFYYSGLGLFSMAWTALMIGLFAGPLQLGKVSIFGMHTMLFALFLGFIGQNLWGAGLYLASRSVTKIRMYKMLVDMGEARLFWLSVFLVMFSLLFLFFVIADWAAHDYRLLSLERETLIVTAFGETGILFVSQCITAHMLKRT